MRIYEEQQTRLIVGDFLRFPVCTFAGGSCRRNVGDYLTPIAAIIVATLQVFGNLLLRREPRPLTDCRLKIS